VAQFAPESLAQFAPDLVAQFDRNIHIGFERKAESVYILDALFPGLFRYISENISKKQVLEDIGLTFELGDRHPFHQVAKLYGFRY
jgi:hypothetical protein